jgi:hypothetical protein
MEWYTNWLHTLEEEQGDNGAVSDSEGNSESPSRSRQVGESSSDLQEEVPHEQLFVNASKPIAPSNQSPSRPKQYPGVVKRKPVTSRHRATEVEVSDNDEVEGSDNDEVEGSDNDEVEGSGVEVEGSGVEVEGSDDEVEGSDTNMASLQSRESQTLRRQPVVSVSSPEVMNGIDPSESGSGKDHDGSMSKPPTAAPKSAAAKEASFPGSGVAEAPPLTSTSPTDRVVTGEGQPRRVGSQDDPPSSSGNQESFQGKPEEIHATNECNDEWNDGKEEIPHERHFVAVSKPTAPSSYRRSTRFPGAVRRIPMVRRGRDDSEDDDSEEYDDDGSEESEEPKEEYVSNSRSQAKGAEIEEQLMVDTSKAVPVDQDPKTVSSHLPDVTTDSSRPGAFPETSQQSDNRDVPIDDSHSEASTSTNKAKKAHTKPLTVETENPAQSIAIAGPHVDQHNAEALDFQDVALSDALTSIEPVTTANTKELPKALEAQVHNAREEGLPRQATGATIVDANELDATNVDTNELDTTELDATELDATELDATELDATELDVTELDATSVDVSSVDATSVEATLRGERGHPGDGEGGQLAEIVPSQAIPQNVEFRSEFEVDRLFASWEDDLDGTSPFEAYPLRHLNCYGIVHVRVLRAQRLPCSVGSNVQAVVSLKPWKGRVRTEKSRTFSGQPTSSGVCAQWDEDESSPISMVHAYSSEESPVPSIQVALVFNPLGVFEFTMCSLTVSCRSLMRAPLIPKRQWLVTRLQEQKDGSPSASAIDDRFPLIQIEAMFEPAESIKRGPPNPADDLEVESTASVDRSLVEDDTSQPPPSQESNPKSQREKSFRSDVSFSLDSRRKGETKPVPSKPHLLRLTKFWTPANCCVCNRSISSVIWTKKAYHCEECGVDCCSDCQLHVDIQLSCGSDLAQRAVAKSIQNTLTLINIMNVLAPVDESVHGKLEEETAPPSASPVSKDKRTIITSSSRVNEEGRGIGTLKLDFVQAHLFEDHLSAETERNFDIDRKGARFRSGDYYVRIAWTGSEKTARTRTIQGTGRPRFESGEMCFNV